MMKISPAYSNRHQKKIERYYRFHSLIYDATRWSFLFGRDMLLNMIPDLPASPRILEIGCGTGRNMKQMQKIYPNAEIAGIDLSSHMLQRVDDKMRRSNSVQLHLGRYGFDELNFSSFDLIFCSYSLTMCGDGLGNIFAQLSQDLKPSGYIAVVDFHSSPYHWFRRWMAKNHVNLSGDILSMLNNQYHSTNVKEKSAYFGLWSYFLFIGQLHP